MDDELCIVMRDCRLHVGGGAHTLNVRPTTCTTGVALELQGGSPGLSTATCEVTCGINLNNKHPASTVPEGVVDTGWVMAPTNSAQPWVMLVSEGAKTHMLVCYI